MEQGFRYVRSDEACSAGEHDPLRMASHTLCINHAATLAKPE